MRSDNTMPTVPKNVAGALERSTGILMNSKTPPGVMKAVFSGRLGTYSLAGDHYVGQGC